MRERPIVKDMNALKELCSPVVDYLKQEHDPYTTIHITSSEVLVTTDECFIPLIENGDQPES